MERKREWCLKGEKVLLVPYSTHHVDKYHRWMQDPVLRSQTASEPLTLEQEYEMQLSWMRDDDKSTFIILSREAYDKDLSSELDSMAGDVNMFLSRETEGAHNNGCCTAEVEIMIAEPSFRGRGLGLEATKLMMGYGIIELGVEIFQAKIGISNQPSLKFFKEKLAFVEVSHSDVFQEVTLELRLTSELVQTYREYFEGHSKWLRYDPRL